MAISYASDVIFNNASTSYASCAFIDSTHFVVAYCDGGNSGRGTAIIGSISGSTITFGTPVNFETTSCSFTSVTVLDSTHFVVAYNLDTPGRGKAVVGVMSGTTISSYGTIAQFFAGNTTKISCLALDSTHFVVNYADGVNNKGSGIAASVATTTITYGSAVNFDTGTVDAVSTCKITSTTFALVYTKNDGKNYAGVGTISGTTLSYGTLNVVENTTNVNIDYNSIALLDSTHVIIAYDDGGGSPSQLYGNCKIGTLSAGAFTYGTRYQFNPSNDASSISVVALSSTQFSISYSNVNNTRAGTSVVGTVSAGVISYSSLYVFKASSSQTITTSANFVDATHFVINYVDGTNSSKGTSVFSTVTADATTNASFLLNFV